MIQAALHDSDRDLAPALQSQTLGHPMSMREFPSCLGGGRQGRGLHVTYCDNIQQYGSLKARGGARPARSLTVNDAVADLGDE